MELTVHTADLSVDNNTFYLNRTLYDGQTKEQLAYARIQKGEKSGNVSDKQHVSTIFKNAGWDDASAYIDAMMAEQR